MEEKLLSYMEKEKIEAFYIHKPENVRYICGYSGGDVYLLMIPGHWYLLTDPEMHGTCTDGMPEVRLY